ncbi:MAG: DISARM system helicase DrmA [Pirellula sp.]|nr:DISARM system helicase DrmA [Pirellula sp.]
MQQSHPSQHQLRAELEQSVLADLLGPSGGEDEEITERTVRDRYLVGVLAPSRGLNVERRSSTEKSSSSEIEEEDEETPSIPDELSDGGSDSADDGKTDADTPVTIAHLPSTLGMTFCVEGAASSFRVSGHWGQYKREKQEDKTDHNGRALLVWKRYPRGGTIDIPLQSGTIKAKAPDPEFPDIYVQGQIRKRNTHYVVTLFLVNAQEELRPKDEFHIFQPKLIATGHDGQAVFCKRTTVGSKNDLEERLMAMLYRHQVEFAVGHGVSVHAEVSKESSDRAVSIETVIVPTYEVPRTAPPTEDDATQNPAFGKLAGLVLDMKLLAEADAKKLSTMLEPLVTAYKDWIQREETKLSDPQQGLEQFGDASRVAIDNCRLTLDRIESGLKLLLKDAKAFESFQFMNRAMWLQRTHSIYAERVRRGEQPDFDNDIDKPANRSWRPFQIAFILLNLPGVTELDHSERGVGPEAIADLLFFPTGGGKTEAYLGLSAYTMGLRRLQGTVAGRIGDEGIAVLMRYTLRLLTIQQFQRATALICACESIRRKALEHGDSRWGNTPFRIGLWVGRKTTPNRTDDAVEAIKQARGNQFVGGGIGTPYQLTACPWCGSAIEAGKHLDAKPYPHGSARTLMYCGDKFGQCLFSKRQAADEGLPVVVVDEEIYRRLPTLLIATVDKFAQMPWKGEIQMLFGQVNGFCERHGFKSPDLEDSTFHPKSKLGLPSARLVEHGPLRPPDLIIQDELHLISGPLGTLVGLYETAIDKLCTWEVNGKQVRPKLIASTATIKNADVQVHSLFLRTVNIFPPPGLDVRDNFFSVQREPTEEEFGRRYLGICAPGRRLKAALIRVYVAYLCSAQMLYERHGKSIDPWMTLVGYFNSMRELGGMRRLVDDAITSLCNKQDRRGLAKRRLYNDGLAELTSRMRSEEIPQILDRLESGFDPELEEKRREAFKTKDYKSIPKKPLDVLLATNMISVGVDVKRLGLMVVAGQPKATAEYIQATSRVGRSFPGLVCTVFNWARPRDLSHYESFEHYHSTFYKHVEPLSVTPFSPGALQRGLSGLLVSLVRLRSAEFNTNEAASRITTGNPYVQDAIETIARRAELIGDGTKTGDFCRAELLSKADLWQAEAQNTTGGRSLTYTESYGADGPKKGTTVKLLQSPGMEKWEEFTCLNSLREVEPSVKFIISDGGLDEISGDIMPEDPITDPVGSSPSMGEQA